MKIRLDHSRENLFYGYIEKIGGGIQHSRIYVALQTGAKELGIRIPKRIYSTLLIAVAILIVVLSLRTTIQNHIIGSSKRGAAEKSERENAQLPGKSVEPVDFLELLNSDEYPLYYLSLRYDISPNLTDETRLKLKEMGSQKFSELGVAGSYVAVIENKRVIREDLNNSGVAKLKFNRVELKSAGMSFGDNSEILLRGHSLSPNRRGINVVAQRKDGFLDRFSFDFYLSSNPTSAVFPKIPPLNDLAAFQIVIEESQFNKLRRKREEALKVGILINSDYDFVPARIKYSDSIYDAKIRLKGDWVDHLTAERKWSYRIELTGEHTLFGMAKFNIQHPATRNYIAEWIFHKALKKEDIIGLRYSFINAELKIVGDSYDSLFDLGTYAMEESFDKFLIENNNRREGVIVRINENLMWEGTVQARNAGLAAGMGEYQLSDYENITVLPFSQKKVLSDTALNQMFTVARNLCYDFVKEKVSIADVFDVERLAKYNAISCLLGANHGLSWHNQRLYYNPVSARFEPIGFDGMAGEPITSIRFYYKSSNDIAYLRAFAQALEQVSKKEYVDSLFSSLKEMDQNLELLNQEFPNFAFDKDLFYKNQSVIANELNPSTAFHAFLLDISDKNLSLQLRSIAPFPVEILNISYKGHRILAKTPRLYILQPEKEQVIDFDLPEFYKNLFVSKKSKKTIFSRIEDIENIVVTYRTYGTSVLRTQHIIPWKEREIDFYKSKVLSLKRETVRDFDFLKIDENKKTITFKSGERTIDHDLVIPKDYAVIAGEGLSLDLVSDAKIISYSPFFFKGSIDNPIHIFSSDGTGQGILVIGSKTRSELLHVNFTNLSNPRQSYWSVSGAVNFYESPVDLKYVVFERNRSEDALNIIRSSFDMYGTIFRKTKSDAFDGDFVRGTINHTLFEDLGNDAIDISGSVVSIRDITIFNAADKGLSAGENSSVNATNIRIVNSEIAVASKDRSTVKIDSIEIENCKLSFTAFQKKSEYGPADIEARNAVNKNCKTPFLIETRSSLLFNGRPIATQSNVVGRLYGVEYGKRSN